MFARFGKVDGVKVCRRFTDDAELRHAHIRRARPVDLQRRLGFLFHGEGECEILIGQFFAELRHAHVAPPEFFTPVVQHAQHAGDVFERIALGAQIVDEQTRRRRVSGFVQFFGFRLAQNARLIRLRNRAPTGIDRQIAHDVVDV